ncbi:MAG: hypothetical protein CMJ94_09860 [Planctomycetes bacterium]|nr:hypothetical protein [Planctomycetota bacterium]
MNLTPIFRASGLLMLAGLLTLPACFSNNRVIGGGGSGNNGSEQGAMFLTQVEWGRLVDVVDQDGALAEQDIVIRPDLRLGADYSLTVNPVTEAETLTILQYSQGTAGFDALLSAAISNLPTVSLKGPASPSPYTQVARNAAIRLNFSRPVKASTVNADTIQFWVGDGNASPADGRYIVDNDEENGLGYVIFDPTISGRQSAELGLPQNASGFRASFDSINDNLLLRIPTAVNVFDGRPEVLESAGGRTIRIASSDPLTTNSDGSQNLVRSMRTGNENDPYNGFLRDNSPPSIVGLFDITLAGVTDLGGEDRRLTYNLAEAVCDGVTAKVGDVVETADGAVLLVTTVNAGAGGPYEVDATLLEGTLPGLPADPSAQLTTRYTDDDAALQTCFIRATPTAATFPAIGLEQDASLIVRFSEAIDPTTVLSMHSLVLTNFETTATAPDVTAIFRQGGEFANETVGEYIDRLRGFHLPLNNTGTAPGAEFGGRVLFGSIEVADGSREFTLTPTAGFVDADGGGSPVFALAVRDGARGITDLAGNPLEFTGFVAGATGAANMRIDCAAPAGSAVKYLALRANATDEDGDGLPEYAGQHTPGQGVFTGRPVVHFSRTSDTANDFVTGNPPTDPLTGQPIYPFEPLTPRGAVVMALWRPGDFGFGAPSTNTAYYDPNEFNIDVEGFSWSPFGGVNDDFFPRVSLSFSHARWIPDETVDLTGRAIYPASGLQASLPFVQNVLGWDEGITETTVFDSSYAVRAVDVFTAASGVEYIPWPEFTELFTFRDTAIPQSIQDGANGTGSPPAAHGLGAAAGGFYDPGSVPSIGLSLLGRFRCYNVGNIEPINQFNSYQFVANSPLPAWRVFSAGGISANGDVITVVPDNGDQGGLQPTGGWRNGTATRPDEDTIYATQADFVVRVSRAYTHWFDFGGVLPANGVRGIVVEPVEAFQLPGTDLIVEYRGSFSVTHPANPTTAPSPLTDAEKTLDLYGDFNNTSGSVSLPSAWTTDLSSLEATATEQYRYFQLRISFVANADRSLPATLDGLGIAFDITP